MFHIILWYSNSGAYPNIIVVPTGTLTHVWRPWLVDMAKRGYASMFTLDCTSTWNYESAFEEPCCFFQMWYCVPFSHWSVPYTS